MDKLILTTFAMLTVTVSFAQNSVSISQSGGAGNQASVTQSGEGNTVSISQMGGAITDSSKPGNRVSLRVPKGTATTINQTNVGPNSVEISQEGQATATISQSSGTDENTITTLPNVAPNDKKHRSLKRRRR